jgi:cbb3-type cytochrome oxidase maturation protein
MNALFLLIPLSLVLVGLAVAIFFWAVHAGQFDDLDSPAYRILLDDPPPSEPEDRTPP